MDLLTTTTTLITDPDWFRIIRKPEYAQFKKDVIAITSFLPSTSKMLERLYLIHHQLDSKPICVNIDCRKLVNWNQDEGKYRKYCTSKCAQSCSSVKDKRLNTIRHRFNADNPMHVDSVVGKQHQTMLDRYGVSTPILDPDIKHKIQETNLKKYGVKYNCTSDNNTEKRKSTNLKKYGVHYPLQSDVVRSKGVDTVIDRYGVDCVLDLPHVRTKQDIARNQTYCEKFPFWSTSNNKDELVNMYSDQNMSQTEIADKLGCSQAVVSKWFNKHDIPAVNQSVSYPHKQILSFIESIYDGTILINDRSIIHPYELDIVLPDIAVAIEVDGIYWHSELNGKNRSYHVNKTNMCNSVGYHLIHVTDKQWYDQQDIVTSRITAKLGKISNRIFARTTTIDCDMGNDETNKFLTDNHIQGTCASSIRYGLRHDGLLVAVMTFGKSRFSPKYDYELIRCCTKRNTVLVGGASKLLKCFIRSHPTVTIVSYADLSWNTGAVYEQLGFEYVHQSKPNYKYFDRTNPFKLFNRISFQKHKLITKLDKFDPNLTEWQNMQNNGYDRIWDCGNGVWILTT